MMAFTTRFGKTKTKFLQLFPLILLRSSLTKLGILNPQLQPLNPLLKPQIENALNV